MKINIVATNDFGWKQYIIYDYTLWFKGYLLNTSINALFRRFHDLLNEEDIQVEKLSGCIQSIRGHFGIIIYNSEKLFCVVDKVRTIPLFYSYDVSNITVSSNANYVVDSSSLDITPYNTEAALEIAMSGYTMGDKTLCHEISQMKAGECLFVDNDKVNIDQYYRYAPWNAIDKSRDILKSDLIQVSRTVLEDMVESCKGRQIVIPLSGGHDSRFVASGLKELGVKDVICFSYGLSNNFEVKTAEKIAEKLGYKHIYVPLSIRSQKVTFSQNMFSEYCDFSDTLCNSPVLIDYSAVKVMVEGKKISKDAIFINGNSGDFISGGHIVPNVSKGLDANLEGILEFILQNITASGSL